MTLTHVDGNMVDVCHAALGFIFMEAWIMLLPFALGQGVVTLVQ